MKELLSGHVLRFRLKTKDGATIKITTERIGWMWSDIPCTKCRDRSVFCVAIKSMYSVVTENFLRS